jgi:hypothetical protein
MYKIWENRDMCEIFSQCPKHARHKAISSIIQMINNPATGIK